MALHSLSSGVVVAAVVGLALSVVGVLVIVASSSWLQRRIVFHPEVLADDVRLTFSRPHDEVWFDGPTGSRLHAVRFAPDGPRPTRAILYLHGNAGSVRTWGEVGADLATAHHAVVYVVDPGG